MEALVVVTGVECCKLAVFLRQAVSVGSASSESTRLADPLQRTVTFLTRTDVICVILRLCLAERAVKFVRAIFAIVTAHSEAL